MATKKEWIMSYGYWLAPNLVLFSPKVSDKQFRIYVYLLSLCASNWFCRPTDAHIWAKFGINRQNTNLHINTLKSLWLIKIEDWKWKYKWKRIIKIENNIRTWWDMPDIDLEMEEVSWKQDLSQKQDRGVSWKQDRGCLENKTPYIWETQVDNWEKCQKIESNITNEYYKLDKYGDEYETSFVNWIQDSRESKLIWDEIDDSTSIDENKNTPDLTLENLVKFYYKRRDREINIKACEKAFSKVNWNETTYNMLKTSLVFFKRDKKLKLSDSKIRQNLETLIWAFKPDRDMLQEREDIILEKLCKLYNDDKKKYDSYSEELINDLPRIERDLREKIRESRRTKICLS